MRTAGQLKYRATRTVAMLTAIKPTLAYLGWTGQGNLGDESILAAQRQIFRNRSFTEIPAHDSQWILSAASRLRSTALPATLLLGGGTVIGRPEWLDRLQTYRNFRPDGQVLVWGAGVEDPDFAGARVHATTQSLKSWSGVLSSIRQVGVRGPRSAELLGDIGIDAVVVGDPALILEPSTPIEAEKGTVAINLGMVEDRYSSDSNDAMKNNVELIQALSKAGRSIRPFAMAPGDAAAIDAAIGASGIAAEPVKNFHDAQGVVDWLAHADVVVSQRLHGSILAAAAATPFVSLDYRPKCLDFAASINRRDLNLRFDVSPPGECAELVEQLSSSRVVEAASISSGVNALRAKLFEGGR